VTTFSGLASLPVIRADFVETHKLLTDRDLTAAVAAGRLGPGPIGLYVVSVGYLAGGVPGAIAGWLAMVTPAFLIIPMLRFLGPRAEKPAIRRVVSAMTLAASGLLIAATVPLGREAISSAWLLAIAGGSCALLVFTRLDSMWIMLGAAFAGTIPVLFAFQ
jgi:chromate transporter